jgi:acyl-CoA reductase-like NAD-dependent aldehyde dehydrogenase
VRGPVRQTSPLDKPAGITGILGAGNFASPIELIAALFLDNQAVAYKAHPLNEKADAVWELILAPLVAVNALRFVDVAAGQELVKDARLTRIYFTGGAPTAHAILKATSTPLISECGGNNPHMIVPGDKPWSDGDIRHHAALLATFGKASGGSVCGRPQTIVICRAWPQRRQFLDAVAEALGTTTPAIRSYYPNSDRTIARFKQDLPAARVIQQAGTVDAAQFLLVEDAQAGTTATQQEAFCQILSEVALDTEPTARAFLPAAVAFSNAKLMGTLAATIIIDDATSKAHRAVLDTAVTALRYGAIGVNVMPVMMWMNAYLTWGGEEADRGEKPLESGDGNFGNALNVEDVVKSIAWCPFRSMGQPTMTSRRGWYRFSRQIARYAISPSWWRMAPLTAALLTRGWR